MYRSGQILRNNICYVKFVYIYLYFDRPHYSFRRLRYDIMWWNIIYNIEYKHWYTIVICGVDKTKKVWKKLQKKYLGQPYRCRCYVHRGNPVCTQHNIYIRNLAKGHKNWNKLMRLSKKYMSKYCRPTFSWKWPFWSPPDMHILLLLFYNPAACILYLQYYTWLVFFLIY